MAEHPLTEAHRLPGPLPVDRLVHPIRRNRDRVLQTSQQCLAGLPGTVVAGCNAVSNPLGVALGPHDDLLELMGRLAHHNLSPHAHVSSTVTSMTSSISSSPGTAQRARSPCCPPGSVARSPTPRWSPDGPAPHGRCRGGRRRRPGRCHLSRRSPRPVGRRHRPASRSASTAACHRDREHRQDRQQERGGGAAQGGAVGGDQDDDRLVADRHFPSADPSSTLRCQQRCNEPGARPRRSRRQPRRPRSDRPSARETIRWSWNLPPHRHPPRSCGACQRAGCAHRTLGCSARSRPDPSAGSADRRLR